MKLYLLILISLYSSLALARICHENDGSAIDELSSQLQSILPQDDFCTELSRAKTKKDLSESLRLEIGRQSQLLADKAQDRHTVGNHLAQCSPTPSSTALVISFQGTGGYEPRVSDLLRKIIQCPQSLTMPVELRNQMHYMILNELKKAGHPNAKWSALDAGPISNMLKDPQLAKLAKNFDFASFPSEETELIAEPQKIGPSELKTLPREIRRSMNSQPLGIQNALKCIEGYQKKARELKINPKIVILSHSSGARTAVKFLEQMKSLGFKSDLVFSIDPVIEAQHAIQEVLSQKAGEKGHEMLEAIPFVELEKRKPVRVWSRKRPKELYKPGNAKKWLNVYQMTDEDGLKMKPAFGIYGSPIHNADKNLFIREGLDSSAHGSIAYHEKTLEMLREALLSL